MTLAEKIADWMRRQLNEAGARGFVFGLSGGIDSAVVAQLSMMASPRTTLGVILPCHSDPEDEKHARLVAERFVVPVIKIDLDPVYDQMVAALRPAQALPSLERRDQTTAAGDPRMRLPLANLKPRLRMAAVYFVANQLDSLVVGSSNKSELSIGYFTKHGDGAADLLPLGNLMKSEVRELARELGVPKPIIDKPPSAGLWLGQTDEGEMGFTYAELEAYLTSGAEHVAPAVAMKIERLARSSEHKRRLPAVYEDDQGNSIK